MRTLELGANPYFTTVLFWEYRDEEPELANYFGFDDKEIDTQVVEYIDAEGVQKKRTVGFRLFNIERDRFPYEDESFGMVLFCEILEHLVEDPVSVLTEINRVTEMGGHLVLTTPNVARAENVARLINGDNLYDPYSGFGPYGRHNREYTLDELEQLLAFSGYTVECGHSADGHPWSPDVRRLEVIRPELEAREGGGFTIQSVRAGSGAARIGLQVGDILLAMNGQPLQDAIALRRSALDLRGRPRALNADAFHHDVRTL